MLTVWMAVALDAVPVMRTIINTPLYHASSSDTRCVTGTHDPTITQTAITHLTLWDTSDPVNPRPGITLSESNGWGFVGYREATVYQKLLIYMDEDYLSILDIDNIYSPVLVYHLRISLVYCLGVYEHYLLLGKQDGGVDVYDLSAPSILRFVGSFQAQPPVWDMWQSGDKLAMICGNYSIHTARLYGFDEAEESFEELASVTGTGRMSYVGELDGKLIMKYEGGGLSVYDYVTTTPPLLLPLQPSIARARKSPDWTSKCPRRDSICGPRMAKNGWPSQMTEWATQ